MSLRIPHHKPFNAQAVTGPLASFTSAVTALTAMDVSAVIDVVQTVASLTGTLTLEVANGTDQDRALEVATASDVMRWQQYTNLTAVGTGVTVSGGSIAVAGTARFVLELKRFGFRWIRFKWVNATGSGTITIDLTEKA